jgi:hypothetical protein
MFTPFRKPPYTYPYGRSVDETMTKMMEYNKKNFVEDISDE